MYVNKVKFISWANMTDVCTDGHKIKSQSIQNLFFALIIVIAVIIIVAITVVISIDAVTIITIVTIVVVVVAAEELIT